jgi:hypothetical protein
MPRIFVFHPVKHQRAVECGLVAQSHVAVLIGDFQQTIANSSAFSFAKLRQFFDDFRCAHGHNLAEISPDWKTQSIGPA